ncbi:ABC-type cobalamin/Fe3+-siderophores transport system ATPase subunit [Salegentibacter sp. 24]|jgi:ABC-type multidrug transport system ATPase subunit|uniref:ATP-binding cassette domain-containing protein n=1 Tax=Salegentibacter sp. 24 TaxID=2183986 RepID=UPI00105D24D0|nr:ABC transporter ATP-binding protein [Salegentibacter sp. 24]TDN87251.1 ABC-type cobalamin/Fe3+-siderophores transport system ATPase subunit [Salegentibacter sp. 24]
MIFELDNVELSFDEKRILYGVYIKAEKGKITGLLGPNGSGKTSLLKIFFGSLSCNNKLVRVNHQGSLKPLYTHKNVKFLPQEDFLPQDMRIISIFKYHKVSWKHFTQRFPSFKAFKNFGLKKLSGGERRLISSWLILKSPSDMVLLDEPFSHLAPVYCEIIKREILIEKHHKAILMTDHLYRDILELSDDLYFLKDGCSRLITTPKELEDHHYLQQGTL